MCSQKTVIQSDIEKDIKQTENIDGSISRDKQESWLIPALESQILPACKALLKLANEVPTLQRERNL